MKNIGSASLFFIFFCFVMSSPAAQQPPNPSSPDGNASPANQLQAYLPLPKIYLSDARVTLFPRQGAQNIIGFPDGGVFVAKRHPSFRLIVPVCDRTVLFEGPDIRHLRSTRTVLTHGLPGSVDNGYAGIHSGYIHEGLAEPAPIIGFYHAEDHEGMPSFPNGVPGYYGRVCGAVSYDQGLTWRKLGPLLQSFKPKEFKFYDPHADRGLGMCGAVKDKTGRYVYLYYTENSRVDETDAFRGVAICMARAALHDMEEWRMIVPRPDLFRKYYNGDFTQPGIGGYDTPVITTHNINAFGHAEASVPQPSYAQEFGLYIMVFNIGWWDDPQTDKSGIYLSFSEDGIAWGIPAQLIKRPGGGPVYLSYATIIWDESDGSADLKKGWLVYSYHPNNVDLRYMAGQRIALSRHQVVEPASRDFVEYHVIDPNIARFDPPPRPRHR